MRRLIILALLLLYATAETRAQDTLRIMAYNVLYYGETPNCQGPVANYHAYLSSIVHYAKPTILALEKMGAIKAAPNATTGNTPYGFADSVLQYALNTGGDTGWAYCPFTNTSLADNLSVLFYKKQYIGFAGIAASYASVTDFNVYKLYYKDPNLPQTHDTTWLYIVPNHTQSGDNKAAVRAAQVGGYLQQMAATFTHLPNFISMGDFNVRNSSEGCYQALTAPADTGFRCYDPPFYPDALRTYPADWDSHAASFAPFLTTSTRESASLPNSCGTDGGAKSWYDHIFISAWLAGGVNYLRYLPQHYTTLGNDGLRTGISVNDPAPHNTAVPDSVADAIFQMSNKYPVMADFVALPNTTGTSIADPDMAPAAIGSAPAADALRVCSTVNNEIIISCPAAMAGLKAAIVLLSADGRMVFRQGVVLQEGSQTIPYPAGVAPGIYRLQIAAQGRVLYQGAVSRQ